MPGIQEWLVRHGLEEYVELFVEQRIEHDVLSELTDADLKDFGIPFGDRKRILRAVTATDTLASNDTARGRALNRRIEFDLAPASLE